MYPSYRRLRPRRALAVLACLLAVPMSGCINKEVESETSAEEQQLKMQMMNQFMQKQQTEAGDKQTSPPQSATP